MHSYICDGMFSHYYIHIYEDHQGETGMLEDWEYPVETAATPADLQLIKRLCEMNPRMRLPQSDPETYDNHSTLIGNIQRNLERPFSDKVESRGILFILFSRFLQQAVPKNKVTDSRIEQTMAYVRKEIAPEETEPVTTETEKEKGTISKETLLGGLNRVFNALKEAKGQDARKVLRDANMEAVVKALQQALDKVRHLDNRNTILINNVREAFYGNPKINTDDLFKEISDILNKKRPDPAGKIVANRQNQVEADLEEPLNINAWLEENDT